MKFLFAEFAFFRSQKRNVKTLLIAMFLYFLTVPLQTTFSSAYILRQTNSVKTMMRDRFPMPQKPEFVFFHYTPLAWRLFCLAFLRGFTQLFASMVPVLLVFCVLRKNEFLLGKVQSLGALVAGVLLYMVGGSLLLYLLAIPIAWSLSKMEFPAAPHGGAGELVAGGMGASH